MPLETPRTLDECFTRERRDASRAIGRRNDGRRDEGHREDHHPALVDATGHQVDDTGRSDGVRGQSDDVRGRAFDTDRLITTAWKSGNFLRHTGIRHGTTVGVVGDGPMALIAFFGATLLGGRVQFDPPNDCTTIEGFRTLVAPADVIDRYTVAPGIQRVCYGGVPPEPAVHHLERGLWSENPSFPPVEIDTETPLLSYGSPPIMPGTSTKSDEAKATDRPTETPEPTSTISHGMAIDRARSFAAKNGIEPGTRVLVRDSFADPRVLVAGVIAPLVAGGTVVLGDVAAEGVSSAVDADHVVAFDDKSNPAVSAWFDGEFEV